ncbi:ABC transporter permease [Neorhizobium lilium]|uniref:ABC transporter permease n=1 Tax=Neorhizobium lilium TaxID=2503024 RepID=A0A444LB22_9HYPH|nr:ABC transporter permease [Neorhizobium lilium]RWX74787.1 ABC transporter permease [Neorhizobium lilium]
MNAHSPRPSATAAAPGVAPARKKKTGSRAWRAVRHNLPFLIGASILLAVALIAICAGVLYPGDPRDMVTLPLSWPLTDNEYPLGSGSLGTDLASGLAHGAQASLLVGVSAASVGLLIGILVGAIGGYFGGIADDILVRITELFQTVPTFLLVIVLVAISGPSLPIIAGAIGVATWPTVARLVRAEFRTLRSNDFVLAARSLGYSTTRIIFGEILPNALPPIVVTTSVLAANAILTEAGLSFLGMGDPNLVSWGSMIADGRSLLRTEWFVTALPGAAITLTVLSLNLVGDGLNDILNPRSESNR